MAGAMAGTAGKLGKSWPIYAVLLVVTLGAGFVVPQVMPVPTAKSESTPTAATQGSLTYAAPTWPEPPDHQSMFLRLGIATAAVLVLCVVSLWVCKRWLQRTPVAANSNAKMKLIESLHLGQRCVIHLVHVTDRPVLVALDGTGIKSMVALPQEFAQVLDEETLEHEPLAA